MMVATRQQHYFLNSQRLRADGAQMLGAQRAGAYPMVMTTSPTAQADARRDEKTAAATLTANCMPDERPPDLGQAPPAAELRCAGARRHIRPHVGDETGPGRGLDNRVLPRCDSRCLCRIRRGNLAKGVSHIR